MIRKKTTFLVVCIVAITILAGAGGFFAAEHLHQANPPAQPASIKPAPEDTHEEATSEKDGHEEAGHDHGAEISDLDRPVDEMWAASCEHGILQHQCDECRYEIGSVKLDPTVIGDNGLIQTGYPEKRLERHLERSFAGEVQLDDTRTVRVASPVSGLITRRFATPGVKVEAGAPLFEVDSPEVAEAKGSYLKAAAGLDLAVKSADREARLFARKIAAEVEVQEARAKRTEAEAEIATARGRLLRLGLTKAEIERISTQNGTSALNGRVVIPASRAGSVIEGNAATGEYVEAGKELLTISDLGTVWVQADLKEADLALAANASGGEAKIDAMGRSFSARLETVAGRMNETTRTAKARFSVDNPEGLLKPGMFVSARILLPTQGETLVVPKVAVLADEGRTFIFTHKEGDYWIRRPVTLGARFGGMVEIASGIAVEQRIVTDGSFLLKSDVLRSKMGAGCAD
jgi:cobalt-zinc-cadmium efflux system membrane fusion protein